MSTASSHRLQNEADAAWNRYATLYQFGGTRQEKVWAFAHALVAEERFMPWGEQDRQRARLETAEIPAV